jgi:hypothetical protein
VLTRPTHNGSRLIPSSCVHRSPYFIYCFKGAYPTARAHWTAESCLFPQEFYAGGGDARYDGLCEYLAAHSASTVRVLSLSVREISRVQSGSTVIVDLEVLRTISFCCLEPDLLEL